MMNYVKRLILILCCLLTSACGSKTVVQETVAFSGEGTYWEATYMYDPELYQDKKVNWVEMQYKGEAPSLSLKDITIQLTCREGIIKGNVGDMHTVVDGNTIKFLVGTVNRTLFEEDEFELEVNFSGQEDMIVLTGGL